MTENAPPCRAVPLPFLPTSHGHPAPDSALALLDDNCTSLDQGVTYGQLRAAIDRLLPFFKSATKGLVFCFLPRSCDSVTAYLTACASGHALVLLDTDTPHGAALIKTYQPEMILAPSCQDFDTADYARTAFPSPTMSLWRAMPRPVMPPHPDLFLVLLTSGSTGSPKGVRLSYTACASNALAIAESLSLTPATRALAHLPLAYSFGLSVLHMQLATGGSVLLSQHGLMSRALWDAARRFEATLFSGVPYHYDMLLRLGIERLNLPHLTCFIQAGGGLKPAMTQTLLTQFQKRGSAFYVMYGQTEAAPRMACLPLHLHPEKSGSAGYALRGGSFSIDAEGTVIYTGPNVMMGYAESRTDLALGDVMHGILPTGDRGQIDSDGILTLTGRQKRIAKLFGNRVDLDNLESAANTYAPSIALEGDNLVHLLTTAQDHAIIAQIKEAVIGTTKIPASWLAVHSVPAFLYLTNGKIDYVGLRTLIGL